MLSTIRPTEIIRGLLILLIAYLLGFLLMVPTGAGFARDAGGGVVVRVFAERYQFS